MKLLVTGGTGFLGSRLIPKLIENGHGVLALARSPSSERKLRALGATPSGATWKAPSPLLCLRSMLSCTRRRIFASRGRARLISRPMSKGQSPCSTRQRKQVLRLSSTSVRPASSWTIKAPQFSMRMKALLPTPTASRLTSRVSRALKRPCWRRTSLAFGR
jgi:hypothetical protein